MAPVLWENASRTAITSFASFYVGACLHFWFRTGANSTGRPIAAFDQINCSCIETVGTGRCAERVLGQRRDRPDNQKWSGRWESNPHGAPFKAYKMRAFEKSERLRVIGVRIFTL
jgi:hypothetical protein